MQIVKPESLLLELHCMPKMYSCRSVRGSRWEDPWRSQVRSHCLWQELAQHDFSKILAAAQACLSATDPKSCSLKMKQIASGGLPHSVSILIQCDRSPH